MSTHNLICNARSSQRRPQIFRFKTVFARQEQTTICKTVDDKENGMYSDFSANSRVWQKPGSARTSFVIPEARDGQEMFHLKTVFAQKKKQGLAKTGLTENKIKFVIDKKTGISKDRDHQDPYLPCQKIPKTARKLFIRKQYLLDNELVVKRV